MLIGTAYWQPFITLLREMITQGAVAETDLDLLKVTDDLDEAMRHFRRTPSTPSASSGCNGPRGGLGSGQSSARRLVSDFLTFEGKLGCCSVWWA